MYHSVDCIRPHVLGLQVWLNWRWHFVLVNTHSCVIMQINRSLHTINVFRNTPLDLFCVQQHTVARLAQIYLHHLLLSYRLLTAILGKKNLGMLTLYSELNIFYNKQDHISKNC
jgi:hypothetical protein